LKKIVVTGGMGVLGSPLIPLLKASGFQPVVIDIAAAPDDSGHGDILNPAIVPSAVAGASGIIHLAAVSRVADGEADPAKCWRVNVEGTKTVVEAALRASSKVWMVFVSSREVYGNPTRALVVEDDPIAPVNIYGRSKAEGEAVVSEARARGLSTACVRLPSVYGSPADFIDRVIPALVGNAVRGKPIHLTGAGQTCDFVHYSDALNGILRIVNLLEEGRQLSTIHLASGRGVALRELATLIKYLSQSRSPVIEEDPRPFDVKGFAGNPSRAEELLGWKARVTLEDGLQDVIGRFRSELPSSGRRVSRSA
jgi:nucleoside-diphosphate-sugar epimerase